MSTPVTRSDVEIFQAALELPPHERGAYLDAACGDDLSARARIEQLLVSHDTSGFMDDSPMPLAPEVEMQFAALKAEESGEWVGPYKLLQEIGEGGFGTVWMAEQEQPIRRRVALKIIKMGMDTKEVVARFEQERQALAMMDHPNIAKILDAGATKWGRPFFVMEMVRGIPITDYCDGRNLSVQERLGVFVQVCHAVQHAHQKGIIHRDIKPSNILVREGDDHKPMPMIIDFGVAKAMDHALTNKPCFTHFDQMIGTPSYMSPEQADVGPMDIDTRSDIYSMGVVLYEILTGKPPFEPERLKKIGQEEIRRVIREEEPAKPSTRLSTLKEIDLTEVAKHRHVAPTKLTAAVRGDLDWIVMKALDKDRNRRYDTADGLAQDVLRHLQNEPVLARPPSFGYKAGKFIRKYKGGVSAAGAVAAALVIGAAVSTRYAFVAGRSLQKTRAAEDRLEITVDMLMRILSVARPEGVEGGLGIEVTVKRALEQAEKDLARDFRGIPSLEADALDALGVTWLAVGRYQDAVRQFQRAMDLREQHMGSDDPTTLKTGNDLAVAYVKAGQLEKALPLCERVLKQRQATLAAEHPHLLISMNNLAGAFLDAGDSQRALALCEKTFETSKSILGADDPDKLKIMGNLARALFAGGNRDEALRLFEQALEKSRKNPGPSHPDTLTSINNLALAYQQSGNIKKALLLFAEALEKSAKISGSDHPETLTSMNNVAGAYSEAKDYKEAIRLYREALEKRRRVLGADHRDTLTTMFNLAVTYEKANELQNALPLYREATEGSERTLGPDEPETWKRMSYLATAYSEVGEFTNALERFEKVWERRKFTLGADHEKTLLSLHWLALTYRDVNNFEKSVALLGEHLAARRRLNENDPEIAKLEDELSKVRLQAARAAGTDNGATSGVRKERE